MHLGEAVEHLQERCCVMLSLQGYDDDGDGDGDDDGVAVGRGVRWPRR
jgi:hypothetical protein